SSMIRMDIYLVLCGVSRPVPLVLHWKITAAMSALYALISIAVLLLVQESTDQLLLLFVSFALILLMGNLLVRRRAGKGGT
ncbi:MAG: hypothetical protein QXW06_05045, partial [Thermoplasmata archaeon]